MDQELSLSARALGAERAQLVCCFVRLPGWSNADNIARWVGVNRLRYADELVKRNVLIRLETGLRHADRYAYILSAYSLECALDKPGRLTDYLPVCLRIFISIIGTWGSRYTHTTWQRGKFCCASRKKTVSKNGATDYGVGRAPE